MTEARLRAATPADAPALTAIFLAARRAAMPYLLNLHSDAETLAWMATVVLAQAGVWLASVDGEPSGFAAVAGDQLDHLYVSPTRQGAGVGRHLLAAVQGTAAARLRLLVFQRNLRARRFYERNGFRLLALRAGADNEEGEPDALYEWRR